jgi:purine nucleoside permease
LGAADAVRQLRTRLVSQGEMVKTLVFLRAQTGSRPGIESDVMVITVIGEECQLWHSQHYVKAQHLPIEGDRPIEVFDV